MHPEGRSWMSPALLPASRHPWITWFEAKSATNSWKSRHHEIGECSFISWTYLAHPWDATPAYIPKVAIYHRKGEEGSFMTGREHMHAAAREGEVLRRERSQVLRLFALCFAIMAALAIALGAMLSVTQAAPFASLKQFRVPTDNSQPRSITNGSDGNLWFTEGNEIFTPNPDDPDAGGTTHRNIGRITPAGEITEFRIDSRDPDNPLPNQCDCLLNDIVQGPDGVLYFTTNNPGLGRITTSGEVLPFVTPNNSLANGAGIDAHGTDVWYADFNNDSLWRYDTTSGGFTQFNVPEPSDVAVDENGI